MPFRLDPGRRERLWGVDPFLQEIQKRGAVRFGSDGRLIAAILRAALHPMWGVGALENGGLSDDGVVPGKYHQQG